MNQNISVLISVYHKEKPLYLDEALLSIENQTLQASEIVLVKDGPLSMELDEMIARHSKSSSIPYIIISLEKNVGLGEALTEGLNHCSYDWIARMDGDDIAVENRFEAQVFYLEQNKEVDVLGSWISEFSSNINNSTGERKSPGDHQSIMQYAKYRNPMNHMTVMFRKDAVTAVGGYLPMSGFEDYYLWIRMLQSGYIFANINEVLVHARTGDDMILRRKGWKYVRDEWAFAKAAWKLNFFSTGVFIRNMFLRLLPRLLPSFLLKKVYNILRKF